MSAPTSGDPLIGQVVDDRYRIRKVIGRGGMGVVYEAEATRLGKRLCAVKVLLPEFTCNENAVARFAREAQVAARVKHPNVVEIFDTGTTRDGLGYIAMELLSGESLDRTLRREGTLPWPRAQRVILQICRALAAAHAQGIVHRDMKPENCFRCSRDDDDDDDFIKVLDFGIAKLTDPEASPEAGRLTATNSVIGTYSYMAYEQICGEEVDHRVDVWSTGVIMYELLTGQLPFQGNNQGQIWRAITGYDPAPMGNIAPLAGIPAALEPIVRQALARKLADRYLTIEALARAVAGVQADGSAPIVTGRLAAVSHADATAATIGVAATLAMDAPRLSQRTAPVSSEGLTELLPAEVSDTNETVVRAAVSPITASDHKTQLAPARPESMQTAVAELPAASEVARTRRGPRRMALLFAGLGLPAAALAVVLSQGTVEPTPLTPPAAPIVESPKPSEAPTPVSEQATGAVPVAPPGPSPALAEPTVVPLASPTPEPTRKPTPPKVAKPAARKPAESFAAQAAKSLKRLADSENIGECFAKNKVLSPLTLQGVEIDITGAVRIVVPARMRGSGLATCIEREFKKWKFPRGGWEDSKYVLISYTLSARFL